VALQFWMVKCERAVIVGPMVRKRVKRVLLQSMIGGIEGLLVGDEPVIVMVELPRTGGKRLVLERAGQVVFGVM